MDAAEADEFEDSAAVNQAAAADDRAGAQRQQPRGMALRRQHQQNEAFWAFKKYKLTKPIKTRFNGNRAHMLIVMTQNCCLFQAECMCLS